MGVAFGASLKGPSLTVQIAIAASTVLSIVALILEYLDKEEEEE